MGRKYIKQRTSRNFVYPNNSLEEYDVEIVHDINNNSVSGTTTPITASTITSTGITFSYSYTWSLNNAEPFVFTGTSYSFLSVHMMEPSTVYYKPWRLVDAVTGTAASTKSGTRSILVTPSQMGISSFSNGVYSFEFRMIGKRAIFPICQNVTISTIPGPTPTPTVTTTKTPTPTPTPTSTPGAPPPSPTPTVTPTSTSGQVSTIFKSGATINVTDTGYIKYTTNVSADVYQFIGSLGVVTLTACIDCNTIVPGFPFADVASFTIIQCGTGCNVPSPSPTPSQTPNECTASEYRIDNSNSGYDVYWSAQNCLNNTVGGTVGAYQIAYTGCIKDGTLTYSGFPNISLSAYC
jgi:hypothetical protein